MVKCNLALQSAEKPCTAGSVRFQRTGLILSIPGRGGRWVGLVEGAMSRVSDRQLIALIERRNLDPSDPQFISEELVQAFLDGHLVPRDAAAAATGGRIIVITDLVEKMIKAGIHKVTDGGKGMAARVYKKLWPKTVPQPPEYVGRFDKVLLVDTTVGLATLVAKGNVMVHTDPASCKDMVPAPTKEDGTPLTRYVAFLHDGANNGDRIVNCRHAFTEDELGLVTREGLFLPIQHESSLRHHTVNLPGSQCGDWYAPCVRWYSIDRPGLDVCDIRQSDWRSGSASRGSAVIHVT